METRTGVKQVDSMRRRFSAGAKPFLAGAFLVTLLGACGGGGGDSDSGSSPAGSPILATSRNLESVRSTGGTTEIAVDAINSNGQRETFSVVSNGSSATVSIVNDKIAVTGLAPGRQDIEITTASGVKKTVAVQVYDPLSMDIGDGLMIRYVNEYDFRFNNLWAFGRAGSFEVQAWHPKVPTGWHALGSYVRSNFTDPNAARDYAMIVVKDESPNQDRLAAPTGYLQIWNSFGSPMNPASVWNPVCPAGFVAMGLVATGGFAAPPLDAVRCVKSANTVPAKVGAWVVDDRGSSADLDLTVWLLDRPDNQLPPEGVAFLPPGTMVGAMTPGSVQDKTKVSPAVVNVLRVNIPVVRTGDARDYEPRLTGFAPYEARVSRAASGVRVPFTIVGDSDPTHTLDWKVKNSPFYTIVREEVYASGEVLDNRQAPLNGTLQYQTAIGWSQNDYNSFSTEVGMEVTTSGTAVFASWEVSLSVKLGWVTSTSTTYSTVATTTYTWTVPPHTYAQVLHVTSQMRVLTETGQDAGVLPMKSNIMKYLQYQ